MKKATVLFFIGVACSSSLFSQYRHYDPDEYSIDYASNFYRWDLYNNATSNQNIAVTSRNKKAK